MKTILYQPLFINPQAYFVFPQLYHIEKGDSYIEPANITGQLIINNKMSTYIGCYFRGLWDKAGDMTMPEFLNNTDIVDMNCVFLNCRIRQEHC